MSGVDDVMLVAYVDGEVAPMTAGEIEASIAADSSVAVRVQHLRASAVLARSGFTDVLHEPVPDRLVGALGGPVMGGMGHAGDGGSGAAPATVVPFERHRPTAAMPRRAMIGWAMAAGLSALVGGHGARSFYRRAPRPGRLPDPPAARPP